MIEPLFKDDAFVADVKETWHCRDDLFLWWLGQSGFLVRYAVWGVLIDPYLSDSLTDKYKGSDKPHMRISRRVVLPDLLGDAIDIGVVTSSHNHTDHLDPLTLDPILERCGPVLVCPAANAPFVRERLGRERDDIGIKGLADGETYTSCSARLGAHPDSGLLRVRAVPSAHDRLDTDEAGRHRYLGYIFESGPYRLYHSGDTVVYDGMADRLRREGPIDVAILPINGKVGNMGGRDAARLAKDIGARLVIPCHYDMFAFNTADPNDEFVPECERIGQPYRVLKLGERFSSSELPPRG